MNAERLVSARGIHTVENYFKDIKFYGKGHEREDLNNVMKRLEHWAHRLYPNYKFVDFVGTVENLSKKKQIQTHMHRYRQNMLEEVANANEQDTEEDNENVDDDANNYPIDELDEIIDQQIQNYTVVPKTPVHDHTFDSIRSSMIASPRLREQSPIEASTPIVAKKIDHQIQSNAVAPLSSDQMAKIAENRRLAQERLRKKKIENEAAQATLTSQTAVDTAVDNNADDTITNETISNEIN